MSYQWPYFCLDARVDKNQNKKIENFISDAFYDEQKVTYETQQLLKSFSIFLKDLEKKPYNPSCGLTLSEFLRQKRNNFFMSLSGPLEKIHSIKNYFVENKDDGYKIPVSLYKYDIEPTSDLIVFVHGGGWTQGNLKTHDYLCRKLTKILNKDVLAIDYRLAPENPHPKQLEDIISVYNYFSNFNYKRLFLCGDSGGGHLCAASCIKIYEEKLKRPHGSILFYPAIGNDFNSRSFQTFECSALTKKGTIAYTNKFVGGDCQNSKNFTNKYVFPVLQKNMKAFPQEIIVSSGYDVLFDGQLKHIKNMIKCDRNDFTWLVYPGVVHGFMNYGKYYDKLVTQVCYTIKKYL